MSSMSILLSSAYFPPVDYFAAIANCEGDVMLESCENYIKQSYRNRANIFACDGVLSLTIPVVHSGNTPITDIGIDYSKKWLQQHQRALISAYRSSPFFEYYQDEIFEILESGEKSLFVLNLKLTELLLENFQIDKRIVLTHEYLHPCTLDHSVIDYRESIHPKKGSPIYSNGSKQKPYYQVFSQKYGFISGLSALDLLFNEGPQAGEFLKI